MNQEEMTRLLCGIVSHVTSMEKDYGDARKALQELGFSDEQMVLFGFPKIVLTVLQDQQKEEME